MPYPEPRLRVTVPSLLTQVSIVHVWIHPSGVDENDSVLWHMQKGSASPVKAPHSAQQGPFWKRGQNKVEQSRASGHCLWKSEWHFPQKLFHRTPNPKMYMEPQKISNDHSTSAKEEQSWRHRTSWFQTILQNYTNRNSTAWHQTDTSINGTEERAQK